MDEKRPYSEPAKDSFLESQAQQPSKKFRTRIWLRAMLTTMALLLLLYQTNKVMQSTYQYIVATTLGQSTYIPDKLILNGIAIEHLDGLQTSHSHGFHDNMKNFMEYTSTFFYTTLNISALQGMLNITLVPSNDIRGWHGELSTPLGTKKSRNILRIRTTLGLPRDKISISQDVRQTWHSHSQRKCRKYLGYICSLIYMSAYNRTSTSTIFVTLPRQTDRSSLPDFGTLYIDVHDTELRIVNTNAGAFSESIYINARGNSSVSAGTLSSEQITIQSGRGPITGTFNTTSTLKISTSNAPILIKANLKSKTDQGNRRYYNPGLIASTSNSPIEATVNLFGKEKSRFTVSAQTSNGHVDLKFPIAPLNNLASIEAATTNGSATVVTHPTFQGPFSLLTTNSTTLLDQSRETLDPAGLGRERQLDYDWYSDDRTSGWVYWSELGGEYEYYGVQVKTTNYPAVLVL